MVCQLKTGAVESVNAVADLCKCCTMSCRQLEVRSHPVLRDTNILYYLPGFRVRRLVSRRVIANISSLRMSSTQLYAPLNTCTLNLHTGLIYIVHPRG
jgi:hypothetical protein